VSNEPPPTPPDPGPGAGPNFTPGQRVGGGRFVLTQLLGQGGMGTVWLARDARLDQNVALKFLPPHVCADPVALDDMRRETVRSIALSHPNIIRIHDLHESAGEVFIAMEYVDGPNLSVLRLQQPQRVFPWEFVEPLVRQLGDALAYAHGERLIHRDLKPANMMLDTRGRLKLADFGIAAILSESHSRVSLKRSTSGTPTYMSPQQMNGHMPSVTDDVYSLGATLYEFVTSRPPFFTGNVVHQVQEVPATPVEERQRELEITNPVPPHVGALILSCLSKDPARRPPSARAVVEWIQPGALPPSPLLPTAGDAPPPEAPGDRVNEVVPDESAAEPPPDEAAPRGTWLKWGLAVALIGVVFAGFYLADRKSKEVRRPAAKAEGRTQIGQSVSLFNSNDLTGWRQTFDSAWTATNKSLRGRLISSTPARSFLIWTNDTLPDEFELSFEFFPSDARAEGNYGFLYFASEPTGNFGPPPSLGIVLGNLNGSVGTLFTRATTDLPRQSPVEVERAWTTASVRVSKGRVTHTVAGQVTAEGTLGANRPAGRQLILEIWIGGSGGLRDVGFRDIQLTPLNATR
jgi:serine/threonine protein kinase